MKSRNQLNPSSTRVTFSLIARMYHDTYQRLCSSIFTARILVALRSFRQETADGETGRDVNEAENHTLHVTFTAGGCGAFACFTRASVSSFSSRDPNHCDQCRPTRTRTLSCFLETRKRTPWLQSFTTQSDTHWIPRLVGPTTNFLTPSIQISRPSSPLARI